ncbi:DedA family protein [Rhodobacter ferrooxidans]|uniref:VTT domain-containing protein n=1 Tax=Rhodobacter ferrooxidans TaxID=371731 RepID=C8S0Q4_9RHOB|nr:VTT domain-containing protein [Rhodobacter sp. SW2]EEW25345.1 hypothetical protein Rsw2DRAFT_1632 [Rhodobacter sp. SW2]
MTSEMDLLALLSSHGIAILAPLAILEGPIITLIAAWLASLGVLVLWQVLVCVIIGDLVGDSILYLVGRYGMGRVPLGWQRWIGLNRRRMVRLARTFQHSGMKILIIGKLTHAAGFAVLLAAGAARMPFPAFLAANFIATVPKSLSLVALGSLAGAAYGQIADGLYWASLAVIGLLVLAVTLRHKLVAWGAP